MASFGVSEVYSLGYLFRKPLSSTPEPWSILLLLHGVAERGDIDPGHIQQALIHRPWWSNIADAQLGTTHAISTTTLSSVTIFVCMKHRASLLTQYHFGLNRSGSTFRFAARASCNVMPIARQQGQWRKTTENSRRTREKSLS